MKKIKAVGFDLFNTLITVESGALRGALDRLVESLRSDGIRFAADAFETAYRETALQMINEAHGSGVETHNRFWISATLQKMGVDILPEDARIAAAVERYFSAFYEMTRIIPGTRELLSRLKGRYVLGLLSNFTHPPAAERILEEMGLTDSFEVVLISGQLGYRKPHPRVFESLVESLGVDRGATAYVGDDIVPDIQGAREAGLRPVWMTYVRDHHLSPAPGIPSVPADPPDETVPRISSWDALERVLEGYPQPS